MVAYDKLLANMKTNKYSKSIIGMDHNLDFIEQDIHPPTAAYIDKNLDHNMLPIITRPTRISKSSATLIDNIFISTKLHSKHKSGVLLDDLSDHMPCYLILPDATFNKPVLNTVHYRNLTSKTKTKIMEKLSLIDWQIELGMGAVEQSFTIFHNKLTNLIEEHTPIRTQKIKPNKQPRAPWISTGTLNSINKNKNYTNKVF